MLSDVVASNSLGSAAGCSSSNADICLPAGERQSAEFESR